MNILQMKDPVRIQYKYLVPIYIFSEIKLRGLVFPQQNYNVLSLNFNIHVSVSDLYISRISLPRVFCCCQIDTTILGTYCINRSQIHDCRNWDWGHAVSFLGIHKSGFWYSAGNLLWTVAAFTNNMHALLDGPGMTGMTGTTRKPV